MREVNKCKKNKKTKQGTRLLFQEHIQVVWHKIKPKAFTLKKLSDGHPRVLHHSLSSLLSPSSEACWKSLWQRFCV